MRVLKRGLVVLVVLAVMAFSVSIAAADATGSATGSMHQRHCSVYYTATVTVPSADKFSISLWEYDNGNYNGLESYDDYSVPDAGTYTVKGKFYVGPGTNDDLELWYYNDGWPGDGERPYQMDTIRDFSCEPSEPQLWWFSVMGLPGGSAEASHPAPDGSLACGLFDVQGWGAKTVDLAEYPDCEGDVSVMCLNSEGNWTDGDVSELTQDGTVVSFMSGQHGTCGFFEK